MHYLKCYTHPPILWTPPQIHGYPEIHAPPPRRVQGGEARRENLLELETRNMENLTCGAVKPVKSQVPVDHTRWAALCTKYCSPSRGMCLAPLRSAGTLCAYECCFTLAPARAGPGRRRLRCLAPGRRTRICILGRWGAHRLRRRVHERRPIWSRGFSLARLESVCGLSPLSLSTRALSP